MELKRQGAPSFLVLIQLLILQLISSQKSSQKLEAIKKKHVFCSYLSKTQYNTPPLCSQLIMKQRAAQNIFH